ncbi:hypothetical protein DXH95_13685 [Sphingorhabdus pulchriflava]|uniref:PepSY-associated TM region n=1 Tax=Sphingorhabdus pulchriflava TaxID=2292257 RepID=A0A371B5V8_9SPHN|nr:hypothetical protein [Sphingorhabdus pulchriflava]RDV02960.1 hypothetical protein DXH95_13685 [Sphingorhabdus pulchriflava]
MNKSKLRNLLVKLHLYGAALLAPFFLLVAITGGLKMAGVEGGTQETPLTVPAGTSFDAKSPQFEDDVRTFLKAQKVNVDFEYIRARGNSFTTRPTSRPHVAFEEKDGQLTAKYVEPDTINALMEIHKGHGPRIYKTLGWVAGLTLFFVVLGGLFIGLLSPAYRKPTIISSLFGSLVFVWAAFFA